MYKSQIKMYTKIFLKLNKKYDVLIYSLDSEKTFFSHF